ncbi:hypothetical protein [Paraburkholderia tropica]|uniref:hypothetical protein n=1 Tax=Paraburkholderia tropica TaxID=92647 RepID=UPI001F1CE2A0|nr:hypothetical protein [Paraburkholderia tropica]
MDNERCHSWKGFMIDTGVFPFGTALPPAGRKAAVAIVRIRRAEQTVADSNLPCYAQQWASVDEAHRAKVENAIRTINADCLSDRGSPAHFRG